MRFRAPFVWCLLLAVAWAASPAPAQRGVSWPVVGGTPSHEAVADSPAPPYRVVWESELEGGPPVAAPVVADGTVVVVGRSEVAALDAASGEVVWTEERAPGTGGPPALGAGLALFVEGSGEEAALRALSLEDGEEAWRLELGGAAPGGVTVAGGRAFVATRAGTVHAVGLEDGAEVWTFPDEAAGQRFESVPAVAEGTVFVTSRDLEDRTSFLHALDEETGRRAWSFRPESVGVDISSASAGAGIVVAGAVDGRSQVAAFDPSDGARRWTTPVRVGFTGRQMPVVLEDAVVAGDGYGHVYRLRPSDGEIVWTFRVPGFMFGGSPTISGGAVLVGDQTGQLSAIDLESGLLVWKRSFGDEQVHPVAAAGDRIYVAGRAGGVAALEHDPEGTLIEEASPTTLFVDRALLNYGAAFVIVGGAISLLGLLRRRWS